MAIFDLIAKIKNELSRKKSLTYPVYVNGTPYKISQAFDRYLKLRIAIKKIIRFRLVEYSKKAVVIGIRYIATYIAIITICDRPQENRPSSHLVMM